MLYTSYFAKVKTFPADSHVYSISNSSPFPLEKLPYLVPSWDLVKRYKDGIIDEASYTAEYIAMLETNKDAILSQILVLPDNSILCCYEGPGKFCHRHILADWLNKHNIKCEEKC